MATSKNIAILCSGFGLGFYIPGALVHRQLLDAGVKSHLFVFETYMTADKKQGIDGSKQAYHKDFKVALTASKLPFDIRNSLDADAVDGLLAHWDALCLDCFVSLSGHWGHILSAYEKRYGRQISVDSMLIDVDLAPSWKGLKKYDPAYFDRYDNIPFYDKATSTVHYALHPNHLERVPLDARPNRIVLHGGGWGMGTYQQTLPELLTTSLEIDVVAYSPDDVKLKDARIAYFSNRSDWRAWAIDPVTGPIFPPVEKLWGERPPVCYNAQNQWLFDHICQAKAIVCKPGAGTLIESFASHTPVILLEPFGAHEKENYALWQALGYGIPFEAWRQSGYAMEPLYAISQKIKRHAQQTPDYLQRLMAKANA